ncbi:Universal stress protein family protein [Anatilimnocola aggregata]|uniref:Universal stress protein family protein n=1 Tax=Anatilimnocola aggregata TaxID=2528021 RepID=A0A517YGB1_9BACT|nr:universal stress protein [Anatilimnocola aggregata]QDU29263.1 Universal stress protein family protein [Anatilimnocola aggregata]
MIKRILVGLAGTTYTPVAIQRGVTLAQSYDAEVTGVAILDSSRLRCEPNREAIRAERMEIALSQIQRSIVDFETACQRASIKHRVVEESGDAFTALIDRARYSDLMVFGLRSVFKYDFLADDPESLLIRLVSAGVRPLIAVSEKYRRISRVIIAFNGTMESAKAMKRFVQMRLWPGAELKIVTFHPSEPKANELLRDAEDYCRAHGYSVCHQSNPGDPKVLLLAAATLWQADMIVMGNSARSVLTRRVLGDTLLETLRNTTIPLFLAQ